MNSHEDYISKLAYQIWESEGKPDGKAKQHWQQACILAAGGKDSVESDIKRAIEKSENKQSPEPPQPDQT